MRTAILVCVVLLSASACKTRPQPTLPRIPDSNQIGGGGSTELPGATVFHSIYRYTGHAAQAHAFYKPELTRRGAMQTGDVWADDNLEHAGPFGSGGSAIPKDCSRPGLWLAVMELPDATRIDVFESVPKR
jgi:hypothetical protein